MFYQRLPNVVEQSSRLILQPVQRALSITLSTPKFYDQDISPVPTKEPQQHQRRLKQWREPFEINRDYELGINIDPENKFFKMFQTKIEFTPWGMAKHLRQKAVEYEKKSQEYNETRHEILGPDLALAHFLTSIGGKVKFKGQNDWVALNEDKKSVNLPDKYEPNYILTEIDASDIALHYEALQNFINVPRIKRISFARSPHFDDWFMDKISNLFPKLEYLDVSDCPNLTERGLEALYRFSELKTLIVTNNHESAAFELTCMMVEDILPGLKIEILKPKKKIEAFISEK